MDYQNDYAMMQQMNSGRSSPTSSMIQSMPINDRSGMPETVNGPAQASMYFPRPVPVMQDPGLTPNIPMKSFNDRQLQQQVQQDNSALYPRRPLYQDQMMQTLINVRRMLMVKLGITQVISMKLRRLIVLITRPNRIM